MITPSSLTRLVTRLRVDPGLIVAAALGLLASWPLLSRPGLPQLTDVEHHIYRTFEVLSAWQSGVWYLRWAPDLYYSYGYPVFHYYAPLTYYLAAAYGALIGGPVAGVKFVLVLALCLGALGSYLFIRELWGVYGGIIGAATYTLAPYFVFVDPYQRGAVPETLALGLGPWLFWAIIRLEQTSSLRRMASAAFILALLSLAHNLMSFAFLGMVLLWFGFEQLFARSTHTADRLRLWAVVIGAVVLGLGLTAFMWLPAALEREAVQYSRATQHTLDDIWRHFLPLSQLLAPVSRNDMLATLAPRIGVAQWVLGLLGAASVWRWRERRVTLGFFLILALGLIGLMLAESRPVWETLPFILHLQFPYRLLGPLMLVLAALAGAAVRWVERWPIAAPTFSTLAMLMCAGLVVRYLDPLPWPDFGPVSVERIFLMERNWGIGTTANDEFLPSDVQSSPQPVASLLDSYATGLVDKVNRNTLPAGTLVSVQAHNSIQDRFHVTGQTAFPLRVYTFYWPGWTAYVDGRPTDIEIGRPEGLIVVPVPAGEHEVVIRLEDTWPRQLGWAISALACIVLLAVRAWPASAPASSLIAATPPTRETLGYAWVPWVVAFGLLGLRAGLNNVNWWRERWPGPAVPTAQIQQYTPLEANLDFLAFDLPENTAHAGDQLPLTLYWQARDLVPTNWRVFVHLLSEDGQLWGQSDKLQPSDALEWKSGLPTSQWPLDRYFPDQHRLQIRLDAPPGRYRLRVGLWDEASGRRLRVLAPEGEPGPLDGVVLNETLTILP